MTHFGINKIRLTVDSISSGYFEKWVNSSKAHRIYSLMLSKYLVNVLYYYIIDLTNGNIWFTDNICLQKCFKHILMCIDISWCQYQLFLQCFCESQVSMSTWSRFLFIWWELMGHRRNSLKANSNIFFHVTERCFIT